MEFTLSSSSLLKELSTLSPVITHSQTMPILENYLFQLRNGILTITAGDNQNWITARMRIESSERLEIAIPAKLLLETLKNLPSQPLTFKIDLESYSVVIVSTTGSYKLSGENALDFPLPPVIEQERVFTIDNEVLQKGIQQTLFAVSKEKIAPAFTGVHVKIESDGVHFVATDGHRIAFYKEKNSRSESPDTLTIPGRSLRLLLQLLSSNQGSTKCTFNDEKIHFNLNNITFTAHLIHKDYSYPYYQEMITKNQSHQVNVNNVALRSVLKRLAIYAQKGTKQISLTMGKEITIQAQDLDFSNEAIEKLPSTYEGESISFAFSVSSLLDILNNIEYTEITLHFENTHTPFLITSETEKEEFIGLVMPVATI